MPCKGIPLQSDNYVYISCTLFSVSYIFIVNFSYVKIFTSFTNFTEKALSNVRNTSLEEAEKEAYYIKMQRELLIYYMR